MAKPKPGIQKIAKTSKGFTFVHSQGMAMVPIGTPAYNAMFDLVEYAEQVATDRMLSRQEKLLRTRPPAPVVQPPAQRTLGESFKRFFRPAAPAGISIVHAPPTPANAHLPPAPIDSGRKPKPPSAAPLRATGLAEKLGLAKKDVPKAPMIFLHHWEFVKGKDGLFLQGKVAGYPNFPDNSEIRTPYLKSYDAENDVFLLPDGSPVSLGHFRPGTHVNAPEMLATAKQSLTPSESDITETSPKSPPEIASLEVGAAGKVRMRFTNKISITTSTSEPLGIVFANMQKEVNLRLPGLDWGNGVQPGTPTVAVPSSSPAVASPATPVAAAPCKPTPVPPPVTSPTVTADEMQAAVMAANASTEEESYEHGVSFDALEAKSKEAPTADEEPHKFEIIGFFPPGEGGSADYVFKVKSGDEIRFVQPPKERELDLLALHTSGKIAGLTIGSASTGSKNVLQIGSLITDDKKVLGWEEAAVLAKPLHAKPTTAPSADVQAPSFYSFNPKQPTTTPSPEP